MRANTIASVVVPVISLAVLGSGEDRHERFFQELQHRFPGRVCFFRGFQEELAHRIDGEGAAEVWSGPLEQAAATRAATAKMAAVCHFCFIRFMFKKLK